MLRPVLFAVLVAAGLLLLALGLAWTSVEDAETARPLGTDASAPSTARLVGAGEETMESLRDPVASEGATAGIGGIEQGDGWTSIVARIEDGRQEPIAGAQLRVRFGREEARALSGTDGAAELRFVLPRAADGAGMPLLEVTCSADGYRTLATTARANPSGPLHLGRLRLEPAAQLLVSVERSDGFPVDGATLLVFQKGVAAYRRPVPEPLPQPSPPRFGALSVETEEKGAGRYLISNLPDAEIDLWANADGCLWSPLYDVLTGAHGTSLEPILVRLQDAPGGRVVRGTVRSPSGVPHASAGLQVLDRETGNRRHSSPSGPGGEFSVVLPEEGGWSIRAYDRSGSFARSEAVPVLGGERGLELTLGAPGKLILRLHLPPGQTVERALVRMGGPGVRTPWSSKSIPSEGPCELSLEPPRPTTWISVHVPGFEIWNSGSLQVDNLPPAIDCHLTPGRCLRGRVLSGDRPMAGVRVSLHRAHEGERRVSTRVTRPGESFDWLAEGVSWCEVDTAESGDFLLPAPPFESFRLAVGAPDGSRPSFGPFGVDAGAHPLELKLPGSGTIEGVLSQRIADRAGIIVGASCGDGRLLQRRSDGAGTFRFEGLAAGPWQLRICEPHAAAVEILLPDPPAPGAPEATWDCEVAAGSTTHVVVADLPPLCTLEGEVRFDGISPPEWTISVYGGDSLILPFDHTLATTGADAKGRFRLELQRSGELLLVLRTMGGVNLIQRVLLRPGLNQWTALVEAEAAEVLGVPPPEGPVQRFFSWECDDGLQILCYVLPPLEDGRVLVGGLPAGPIRLLERPFFPRRGLLEPGWEEIGSLGPARDGVRELVLAER